MQGNDPYTRLVPSGSQVARDYARTKVMMLQDLLRHSPTLFSTFMAWARGGPPPALPSADWHYLVTHSLIRSDNTLEEATRDIARMSVSGTPGSWTINPEVF